MKRKLTELSGALGVLLAFAAMSGKATAATFTYSDVDVITKPMTANTGSGTYTGTFDFQPPDNDANTFTAVGFGPASGTYVSNFGYQLGQPIIEGTVTFFFKDPKGGTETGTVTALSTTIGNISSFANYSIFSEGLELNILASITATGHLTYTVKANTGNFDLIAGIGTITVYVPDGGSTLVMLGGSLLGVAALRKRFFRAKN